jgi:hypothetical protein
MDSIVGMMNWDAGSVVVFNGSIAGTTKSLIPEGSG